MLLTCSSELRDIRHHGADAPGAQPGAAADGYRACFLPSGLSPSVPELHRINRATAMRHGSRTVTAGSDFHRPRSTLSCSSSSVTRAIRGSVPSPDDRPGGDPPRPAKLVSIGRNHFTAAQRLRVHAENIESNIRARARPPGGHGTSSTAGPIPRRHRSSQSLRGYGRRADPAATPSSANVRPPSQRSPQGRLTDADQWLAAVAMSRRWSTMAAASSAL